MQPELWDEISINYEANRISLLKLSFTHHKKVAVGDETRHLFVLALLREQLRLPCSLAALSLQNRGWLGPHSATSYYYIKEQLLSQGKHIIGSV